MKDPKFFPDIFEASFILLCLFVIQLFMGNVFYYLVGSYEAGDPFVIGIVSVLSAGIAISFLMSYKGIWYNEIIHFSSHSIVKIIKIIILPLLFACLGLFIFEFQMNKLIESAFPMSPFYEHMFLRLTDRGITSIITVCFIAPIVEELLFRGIILKSFIEQYSLKKSIIASSLLFAIFHLNIYQFIIAFTFGMLSGWLYVNSRSLFPSIIGHFFVNSLTITYSKLNKFVDVFPFSKTFTMFETIIFNMTGFAFLILGLILLYRIFKRRGMTPKFFDIKAFRRG